MPGTRLSSAGGALARCAYTSASASCLDKRPPSRERLEQQHAQRVQIRAGVQPARGTPGLLGRDIGERALQRLGNARLRRLLRQAPRRCRSQRARPRQSLVDQDVLRLYVFVDDSGGMHALEHAAKRQRDAQPRLER